MEAHSVHHIAPCQVEARRIGLSSIKDDQVLIKTKYSAVSPGTESMIFRGRVSKSHEQDLTIQSLGGDFSYPFSYGYALVGSVIEAGDNAPSHWQGEEVFAFHPHQDYAIVSISDCLLIPDGISPLGALFLANMESALNFVMDAHPNIGDTVMVFGQGIVGLLTTSLLEELPLMQLITADPLPDRRRRSIACGATRSIDPNDPVVWEKLKQSLFDRNSPQAVGLDIAFELSGTTKALNQAIVLTGFAGKILIGSWYGVDAEALDLGGDFHRRRIQLISSQVSTLNPVLSGRWNKARRIDLAWEWIKKIKPESFITHRFAIEQCQEAFDLISARSDGVMQVIFEY